MGKVPKLKNRGEYCHQVSSLEQVLLIQNFIVEVSVHSRAARREEPKTEVAKGATVESDYKPWLHSTQSGAIQKKPKKKVLTRAQKARQQKGIEKAEQDAEKLEKKIADSKKSAKNIKARAADWDDLNEDVVAKKDAFRKVKPDQSEKPVAKHVGDRDGDEVLPDLDATVPIKAAETFVAPTVPEGAPAWASMHAQTKDFEVDEVT